VLCVNKGSDVKVFCNVCVCGYVVFVWECYVVYEHCNCMGILCLCTYIVFVWVDCICVGILYSYGYILFV
jgi:hypothetical protein